MYSGTIDRIKKLYRGSRTLDTILKTVKTSKALVQSGRMTTPYL